MKVVNLGEVRELLERWNAVRTEIVNGNVDAFSLTVRTRGEERTFLGGAYRDNPEAALSAALAMGWEMTQQDGTTCG